MKIRRADLIAALDVKIAEGRKLIDETNAQTQADNDAEMLAWQDTRAKLIVASKNFTKTLQSKTFDGNVVKAVDRVLAEQGFASKWGERSFGQHTAPKPTALREYDLELPGLRRLLDAVDEEWLAVSSLERLGFKSAQFAKLFRSLFVAQQSEVKA